MTLAAFHPAVARWFEGAFPAPTPAQAAAWPAIMAGRNTLVAAPTGSGKTLTAFLAAIDALVREGLANGGELPDRTTVVYVSPLKALSNDIYLNLEAPLAGIRDALLELGLPDVQIRTAVRTGDTPQSERAQLRRKPPHILVTTPESLYVLLGSASGRAMLGTVRSVIVDEIHALADDKRGSHLALSLERLEALCGRPLVRIGLSATQKPVEEVARFLVGAANVYPSRADLAGAAIPGAAIPGAAIPGAAIPGAAIPGAGEQAGADGVREDAAVRIGGTATIDVPDCAIVDIGYAKQRDLALELPPTPLSAVMSNDQWEQVYARLVELVREHRTTLVFVNTRRMAERAAFHLGELLGREVVGTHHGSLSKELRLEAEQKLKRGELQALVATASLELGLDIGDVDLVCQLGSPRSIAAFLQRAGRSGHHVGGVPKARLFPQTRDELVECAALLDCVRRGELDALRVLPAPLDVLSQQIVAEVAASEWDEDALYEWFRRAWPYAKLERAKFDEVVKMLADGFSDRRGPRAGWLHRDAVNRRLRGRQGARMVATMSGGTIPETGDYAVVLEPSSTFIGSVNEDFAVESMAGDIFQLGNASYRILRVEMGRVRGEDAQGMPPSIPFWLGEAPGRTDELSFGVSRLREELASRMRGLRVVQAQPPVVDGGAVSDGEADGQVRLDGGEDAVEWLCGEVGLPEAAARQLVDYLGATMLALGAMPTQRRVVLERFFDETGSTHLVVHSPYGSRLNRAWGLALRKRFCRQFNFELQAAATEEAIVLSLSTSHSFPLIEVSKYLHSSSAQDVLVQALLDAPLFPVRWRWNATTALALPRFVGGKKVPPQLQRMKSEDLLATVFPDQVACLENIVGERQVPDHPLVAQTLDDCLHEAMDTEGWLQLLRGLESGAVEVVACDVTAPSPLAAEALNARPYAFLDDAPLEERRTQAVQTRRYADPQSAGDLGRLDADAVEQVRAEAWPRARNADEMHEVLTGLGFVTLAEAAREPAWEPLLQSLARDARATRVTAAGRQWWVAAERLPQLLALHPSALRQPGIAVPEEFARVEWSAEDAAVALLRSRLTGLGPVGAAALADSLGIAPLAADMALLKLQSQGYAMQGRFSPGAAGEGWGERHLLARLHRYTPKRLRREIEPVAPRDFMRFLFDWQRVSKDGRVSGPEALAGVLAQLEGFEAPAAAGGSELLPARVRDYSIGWLDDLCTAGRTLWTRLRPATAEPGAPRGPASLRSTPVLLLPRRNAVHWTTLARGPSGEPQADVVALSSRAQKLADFLAAHGASFFDEMVAGTRLLQTEVEDALAELVARGRAHCDSFAGLRALLVPASKRPTPGHGRRRAMMLGIEDAGRWALVRRVPAVVQEATADRGRPVRPDPEAVEHVARVLLRRYGVVCWRVLEREAAWLPPWRELLRVYHRLEARGEVRGGRFISGLSGEQFALPEAIGLLRKARQKPDDGTLVCVSALDPLNLSGTVVAGEKGPRIPGARLLYRDGMPLAALVAGEVQPMAAMGVLEEQEPELRATVRKALLREPASGAEALLAQLHAGPLPL
ncbi:DEAD/DEAH box helicase [Pseudoxanthomonas koreensis]|uniref:DEAD/DEAH box helicase n=1 Tax=Pseudoxanthomonas koreensis TaxID=266061 RepID=UPI001391E129|nr:DEAD/DEAH box helicase [Pseudoxanthomonas koreensis]KAF1696575.1 ATP-dependent DNA helicase [Pseudoxanthomonas koreensis]